MKPSALLTVSILFVASMAITCAGAQSPAGEVGPVDRTLEPGPKEPDPKACPPSVLAEVHRPVVDKQGNINVKICKEGEVEPCVDRYVHIDCNLRLESTDVVTRTLLMQASSSGVTVRCNGANIQGTHWEDNREAIVVEAAAENITVHNCTVDGSIRVAGYNLETHWDRNHTTTIQARSPKNILFNELIIRAKGEVPFYVFAGALRVTLMNSEISGPSNGPAVYLDAESAEHVIKDNEIGVETNGREQMSIDGSARNLIVGNRFSDLNNGGIFIYRNCGEKGTIRHQEPADNVILDNIFDYKNYTGFRPAVWIASRQDDESVGYCGDDDVTGAPELGSNLDSFDHAKRIVVAQNRFIGRDLSGHVYVANPPGPVSIVPVDLIKIGRERRDDDPSYIFDNVRDDQAGNRNSSCYVANGYPTPIVAHGKSIAMFDDGSGPRCTGQRLSCNDGRLIPGQANCAPEVASRLSVVAFQCRAETNNGGCAGQAACPIGTSVTAIKAACDLEYGPVTDEQLSKTPWSFAGVVRRSDKPSDGVCVVGGVDVSERGAVLGVPGAGPIAFSCREHDDNGGDCHVRGALACAANPLLENR